MSNNLRIANKKESQGLIFLPDVIELHRFHNLKRQIPVYYWAIALAMVLDEKLSW